MKIKVIQENNIVVVTVLSLSKKILSKFKNRRTIELIKYNQNYLEINLYQKKHPESFSVGSNSLSLGFSSIGMSGNWVFINTEAADNFVRKLKNSVILINHGTIEELNIANAPRETIIEILE